MIGHTGVISFEALRWIHDIEAAFVQIDSDGQVIATTASLGFGDSKLTESNHSAGRAPYRRKPEP